MPELKPIGKDAVPRALLRAERYRLLNEPREAESICRDVLAAEPANHDATVFLILALTDLFDEQGAKPDEARSLVSRLGDPYEREYYAGVIDERWGKALLGEGFSRELAIKYLRDAMGHFDRAEGIAPAGNDDAVLRWNACVRLIERHGLASAIEGNDGSDENLDDDVPVR